MAGSRAVMASPGSREEMLPASQVGRAAMSWPPALLALLVCCTGCHSQLKLHQPLSASSPLGTTVHLPCILSSDHDIRVYSIYWYQQRPGHPPRFLLRYFSHSDKHHGPDSSPRFSGSKNAARNQGYLSISELQPEDEAMYYCALGAQRLEENEIEQRRRNQK